MKTNKMMRTAAVLTVLCLLTSCIISGTFAKYVTSDKASDTARVAKWGVALQVEGDLYGEYYDGTNHTPTTSKSSNTITVAKSSSTTATDNVVAPGTKNESGFSFKLTGTPEVSSVIEVTMTTQNIFLAAGTYGIMVEVDSVTEENFAGGEYYTLSDSTYTLATTYSSSDTYYTLEDKTEVSSTYYPVVYSLAGDIKSAGSTNSDSLAAVATAISGVFSEATSTSTETSDGVTTYTIKSKTYEPNTDLSSVLALSNETITWEWTFEQDMDGADTILGDLAADGDYTVVKLSGDNYTSELTKNKDYCVDTQFSLEISVTQVD